MWRNIVARFRYIPEDESPYRDHAIVLGRAGYYAARIVISDCGGYFTFWHDVKWVTLKDLLTWVETNRAN